MDSWCHPYERELVILAEIRNWNSIYVRTQKKKLSTLGTGLPFREPSLAIVLISDIKSTYFLLSVKQLSQSLRPFSVLQVIIRSLEKRLTEKFLLSVPPKISKCLRLPRIFMSHNDNKLFLISSDIMRVAQLFPLSAAFHPSKRFFVSHSFSISILICEKLGTEKLCCLSTFLHFFDFSFFVNWNHVFPYQQVATRQLGYFKRVARHDELTVNWTIVSFATHQRR